MKIVFPMAGSGQRFVNAGYTQHKPLIPICGRAMIAHVLDMFEPTDSFVFIVDRNHLVDGIDDRLRELVPGCTVIGIAPHNKGPCFTTAAAYDHIEDNEPVVICYCDGTMHWDRVEFMRRVTEERLDGMLYTNTGFHPHTLSTTKLAFLRVNANGLLTEIKEKASYTDDPLNEHSSSGVYFFSKGRYVKYYFNRLMNEGLHHNGEYYVTLVYNLMAQDCLRIGYYDCADTAILGTPEEVRNFEAWTTILQGHQVRSEEDALRCYRYWKNYHRK